MILKKFQDTQFKLIVHDTGFEFFGLKENPQHCGDYDYDNPFEYWEGGFNPEGEDDDAE